ncbi:MAG TPA: DUF2490 domain-containing protein [Cyclobacteriaceae bacterium]|nr:DUF2490 domain-containing protein [Cyclobacteriaceae bacterium]
MLQRLCCLMILVICFFPTFSQRSEQLWLDFQLSYPFANRYLLENTASYQTLLSKEGKWRNLSISPVFEYVLINWIDLLSEIPIGYTNQTDGVSSFEIMPMVGARFYITQGKRIDMRFVLRYQVRAFRQIEDDDWDYSNRTRVRGEMFLCINGPNLFTDNLWYGFLDYEEFLVLDQQLDERFANRRRARIGLAYRLNYKHRFELSYTRQTSRNEIEGDFTSGDNVIQAKYKMFLNPAKPVRVDE